MKLISNSIIILVALSFLILSGCVTQKKYDELLSKNVKMEGRIDDLTKKLEIANKKIEDHSSYYNYNISDCNSSQAK